MTAKSSKPAQWARWRWSNGLGRWHRLFTDGDLSKTACGSKRKSDAHVAEQTAERPGGGNVCPVCRDLDDILRKVMTGQLTDLVAGAAPVLTVPAAAERPLAPVGVCTCGCVRSDEVVAYRAALAAWEDAERLRKQAEFEAFLASQPMPQERRDRLARIHETYPEAAREAVL